MVLPRDDPNPQSGGRSTGGGTAGTGQGDGATTSGGSVRPAAPVRSFGNAVSLPAMEKLKGRQNYASWSFAMKMILIREGTWRAVKPAENQDVDPEMCERAFATICLSLEKQNYSLVKTAKSAREAWEKLQQAFQDNGLIRRFGLLDKLTSVKLEECETVEDYVDQLVTTSNDLSEIGFEVNDQWLASLLLKGLPEYYNPMIMGLQASGINLTADVVKTKIIQDVKWPLKSSSAGGALYTKPKPKHSKVDKKSGLCFTCNKPGHFASSCPQKSTSKPKGKALCATLAVGAGSEDCWYFDSGATAHMTRSKDGFVKQMDWVHPIDTASSHSIKSVAKGTVNLDLDEGPIEVKDVLMVPELSTNLLSISKICKKNMTVLFKAEGCEVRDENGDIVVTGIQQDGMYKLITKKPQRNF